MVRMDGSKKTLYSHRCAQATPGLAGARNRYSSGASTDGVTDTSSISFADSGSPTLVPNTYTTLSGARGAAGFKTLPRCRVHDLTPERAFPRSQVLAWMQPTKAACPTKPPFRPFSLMHIGRDHLHKRQLQRGYHNTIPPSSYLPSSPGLLGAGCGSLQAEAGKSRGERETTFLLYPSLAYLPTYWNPSLAVRKHRPIERQKHGDTK